MDSKIYVNLTLMLLLALVVSVPTSAQDDTGLASSDANAQEGYTINVDLPDAIVQDLTITDTLPQGLIYRSDSLEVMGTEVTPSETISSPCDGSQPTIITWSFGQVNNSDDQDILIRFQPIVADVASNKDGETLAANRVSLQFTDDSGEVYTTSGETASVKLIEPDLEMALSSSPESGRTATYSASIGHTSMSHADAFGCDLSIMLPAGITYSPGSAEIVAAPPGELNDANPQEIKMHFGDIDRSWSKDSMILLRFQANTTVENGADPSEIKATLDWKSAPEDNPGTRSYTTSQSIPVPAYIPSYSLDINQVAEPDPVEAGQALHYTINYANTGPDKVHGVTLEETYDQNVTYLSAIPMPDANTENQWTIGDMKPGETGSLEVTVQVNSGIADGTVLRNLVRMSCEEQATAEAIADTKVKGVASKPAAELSSNSTNSTMPENKTEESQDLLRNITVSITENITENTTVAMPLANATKFEMKSSDQENITSVANVTLESDPDANQKSEELVDQKTDANAVLDNSINQSDATGSSVKEISNHIIEIEKSSGMENEAHASDRIDQSITEKIFTLSFEDGTKVDIVVEKSNPLMDTTYAMLNETDAKSNDGGSSMFNGNDSALSSNITEKSLGNQTDVAINKTLEERILLGNESERSENEPVLLDNSSDISSQTVAVNVNSESNAPINQADQGENLPIISVEQLALGGNLPTEAMNAPNSYLLESPPEPEVNQTEVTVTSK